MNIAISVESTADLPLELIKKYDIQLLPANVILGDEFKRDNELTPIQIFEYVAKTKKLPKTAAINEAQFEEHFSNILKKFDAILHFSLSSGLSATCSQAKASAAKFKNVFVIDTKSLSSGSGLLALWAAEELQNNPKVSAGELFEKVSAIVPNVQASFVIERLDFLYKGGRCSGLQLLGANIFGLKPQILLKDGKMGVGKKFRGKIDQVVKQYCEQVLNVNPSPDLKNAFVTYTTATPQMVAEAKTALQKAGFKNIYESTAGCTIASHCGEHTLGILFINK